MKRIIVAPYGNLGNHLFQYMMALRLKWEVPEAEIHGVKLPYWDIYHGPSTGHPSFSMSLRGHVIPLDVVIQALRHVPSLDVRITTLQNRYAYYASQIGLYRSVLASRRAVQGRGSGHLVVNVRAAEILTGVHPGYVPTPLSVIRHLESETKLALTFVGQIGADDYSKAISTHFPRAEFVSHSDPFEDFEFIRNSENVAICVSTFSWLAAWLSERARRIYMPLVGLYHPQYRPDVDLLPMGDERYHFIDTGALSWSGKPEELVRLADPTGHAAVPLSHAEVMSAFSGLVGGYGLEHTAVSLGNP